MIDPLCPSSWHRPRRVGRSSSPPPVFNSRSFRQTWTKHLLTGEPRENLCASRRAGKGRRGLAAIVSRPDHPCGGHGRRRGRAADGEAGRCEGRRIDAQRVVGRRASGPYRCGRPGSRRAGGRSRHDRGPIQPPERRRDCLVSLDGRVRGEGRWVRHPGARRAIYRWDRRFLVECRRTADRDGLPAAVSRPVPGRGQAGSIDRVER